MVADAACDLQVKAIVDGSGISGTGAPPLRETPGESEPACDGTLLWESAGGVGKVGLAYVTEMKGGQATRVEASDRRLQAIDLKAPMPSAQGRTTIPPDAVGECRLRRQRIITPISTQREWRRRLSSTASRAFASRTEPRGRDLERLYSTHRRG